MKYDFDIAVIGAGPAGSSLSFLLGQAGYKVCLIEKKEFPRETLCGEFLSKEVTKFLIINNLFEEFLSLSPNRIKKFSLITNNGDRLNADLGFEAFGLRRGVFDKFLLDKTIQKNITLMQPAAVEDIRQAEDHVELRIRNGNQNHVIHCEYAAAAYGKRNILDKKIARSFLGKRSKMNGFKIHLRSEQLKNLSEDEISIFTSKGIYCGINFVDNKYATLCFLHDKGTRNTSAKDEIEYLKKENKYFKNIFSATNEVDMENIDVYGAGNIYFGRKKLAEKRIFFLGDAAGVIAPFVGDGIGMAIQSAEIVAEIISAENSAASKMKKYEMIWGQAFNKRLRTAYWAQKILLNDRLHYFPRILFKLYPELIDYFIRLTRA